MTTSDRGGAGETAGAGLSGGQSEGRRGILAMIGACTIWGLSPIYYKHLAEVPPLEVLAHRTLWSLVFFGVVLVLQRRLGEVGRLLRGQAGWVALAALMISANWFVYILSVQIDRAMEASLGYYIFPLFAVILGILAFGERLSRGKAAAILLAAAAVSILTFGLGAVPLISLFLAASFAGYGVLKKRIDAGPTVSVTGEVLILAPLAAVFLAGLHGGLWSEGRPGAWFGRDWGVSLMLVFSGPLTAVPLVLLSYASRRISFGALGLTQYLNPTLQFLCAVFLFREPFTRWHLAAFALIWLAVAVFSAESLRQDRAARRAGARAATSGTAVT